MNLINYFPTKLKNRHLNYKELYLLMGYGTHTPTEDILQIIDDMFAFLQTICTAHCGYKIFRGKRIDKAVVEINKQTFNTGIIIATAMKEAEQIAVFTATLGNEFDNWYQQIKQEDDILKEFIANSLGSILAEGVVEELIEILAVEAKKNGLKISNNYSPGYCDWSLIEQKKLFSLLPEGISKIELSNSCLMLPIKSVSGIIAVGPNVKKRTYQCDICKMENCVRNKKFLN